MANNTEPQQPMTREKLEAARSHIARWMMPDMRNDLIDALAEVERQRELLDALARQSRFEHERREAREKALMEVVRAVAESDTLAYESDDGDDQRCTLCEIYEDEQGHWTLPHVNDYHDWPHNPDCPVVKARALVASQTGDGEQAAPGEA